MSTGVEVAKHGLNWILEKIPSKSLQCPECIAPRKHIAWTIVDQSSQNAPDVIIVSAVCRCDICGCEFVVTREEVCEEAK